MRKLLATCLIASTALVGATLLDGGSSWADADKANRCFSRAALGEWVERNAPQAKTMALAGEEARLFMAGLNARPPQTAYEADEIVIVDLPDDAVAVRVGLFRAGCLIQTGRMPRAMLRSLLADVERGKA